MIGFYLPSEASSLLITEVHWLPAILCRPEHNRQGLSPYLSSEDPGVFSSRNNGLQKYDLSLGWHPGQSYRQTTPVSVASGLSSEGGQRGFARSWGDLYPAQKHTFTESADMGNSVEFEPHAGELGDLVQVECLQDHVVWGPSLL